MAHGPIPDKPESVKSWVTEHLRRLTSHRKERGDQDDQLDSLIDDGLDILALVKVVAEEDAAEARYHAAKEAAEAADRAGDIAAFEEHIREADRIGGEAWGRYFDRHEVDLEADLASELRRLGYEPTPGQLRWLKSVTLIPSL